MSDPKGWVHDYVTQSEHNAIDGSIVPAGSKCRAIRSPEGAVLLLKFEDGREIFLDGRNWHLSGIESPERPPTLKFTRYMMEDEDARFILVLDDSIKLLEDEERNKTSAGEASTGEKNGNEADPVRTDSTPTDG